MFPAEFVQNVSKDDSMASFRFISESGITKSWACLPSQMQIVQCNTQFFQFKTLSEMLNNHWYIEALSQKTPVLRNLLLVSTFKIQLAREKESAVELKTFFFSCLNCKRVAIDGVKYFEST